MAADSSTSAQRRRATKPLIEKRRRARINCSLAQLREIVAKPGSEAQQNRSNRLEKADILEMTVEYVKRIHGSTSSTDLAVDGSPDPESYFRDGYRLCMAEVQNFFLKNYRKQASKQFLNRSLQNYLQQIFQRTVAGTPNERELNLEFHSEHSNYSTDDEVAESDAGGRGSGGKLAIDAMWRPW